MLILQDTVFLTSEEMAARLRISLRKLQTMVKSGNAPDHIKLGTRLLFVLHKEVDHV